MYHTVSPRPAHPRLPPCSSAHPYTSPVHILHLGLPRASLCTASARGLCLSPLLYHHFHAKHAFPTDDFPTLPTLLANCSTSIHVLSTALSIQKPKICISIPLIRKVRCRLLAGAYLSGSCDISGAVGWERSRTLGSEGPGPGWDRAVSPQHEATLYQNAGHGGRRECTAGRKSRNIALGN